jgi:hypothetical protein
MRPADREPIVEQGDAALARLLAGGAVSTPGGQLADVRAALELARTARTLVQELWRAEWRIDLLERELQQLQATADDR